MQLGGLSELSARLHVVDADEDETVCGWSGDDYYDKIVWAPCVRGIRRSCGDRIADAWFTCKQLRRGSSGTLEDVQERERKRASTFS
ncbi:hypothetical protein A0H81_07254 [Grifola frondosa]|uniref:Uncharacterized protein n=1 Tax=Grifola frondosa TaxID=5627 RepID=A0A1C7M950_GRIFR|nr:hypothetical protein A0H81_07254 [Grifola frondosa]